jgi:hypothetical protein
MLDPAMHRCGEIRCIYCGVYVPQLSWDRHQCYIKATSDRVLPPANQKYLFFDIESEQLADGSHRPILVCSYRTCLKCIDYFDAENDTTQCCGQRLQVFWGEESMRKFIDYAVFGELDKPIILSHAGGRYAVYNVTTAYISFFF